MDHALSPYDAERIIHRQLLLCPECGEESRTRPAEGVPAQLLRRCERCEGVFVMECEDEQVYVEDEVDEEKL